MGQDKTGLQAIALRLLSALATVDRQLVYRFDLESDTLTVSAEVQDIGFHVISPDALPTLSRLPGAQFTGRFQRFLNQGQVGHYLTLDGEPVYYHWCKMKRKPGALSCTQDATETGTAYLHRGMAKKALRKTGLGTFMIYRTVEFFREQPGVTRIEVAIQPKNIPSQKLFLKCGFTKVREFTQIVLLIFLHIHIVRELQPDGTPGPGKLRFNLRVPLMFWSPALFKLSAYRKIMNRLA